MGNIYVWILVTALATLSVRVVPVLVIRRPIENEFVKSFLYYVPYVTLAVMTFPAMVEATQSPLAGALAMGVGLLCAWLSGNLFITAATCSLVVLLAEFFL